MIGRALSLCLLVLVLVFTTSAWSCFGTSSGGTSSVNGFTVTTLNIQPTIIGIPIVTFCARY